MLKQDLAEPREITEAMLREWPLPEPQGDKYDRGGVLIVGGSAQTPGAVLLAGIAALRSGAGRLQLAVAESTAAGLAISVPEAMVIALEEDSSNGAVKADAAEALAEMLHGADAVCLGPGLFESPADPGFSIRVLELLNDGSRVVIDAYSLGELAENGREHIARTKAVLTPNAKEVARLLKIDVPESRAERAKAARAAAEEFRACVLMHAYVATPAGGLWMEPEADVGLGTSGSGDVLAGLVAGLLARGADPAQAGVWATHTHALAGQRLGPIGYLARELLDEIPDALAQVTDGTWSS